MNLLNLKYFVDIANHGGISAAARVNIIAQQSMSDHLKKLEQYYGTPLFFRTKPLTLTPAGEILFHAAQEVLTRLEQAKQDIRAASPQQEAVLGLGLIYSDIPPFLGDLLAQFPKQEGTNFTVRVHSDCIRTTPFPDDVELILSPFSPAPDWESITLFEDRVAAVVRADLMDMVYGSRRAAVEKAVRETGDLTLLSELPFLQFTPDGPTPDVSSAESLHLPNIVLRTGNGELQNSACRTGQCAITLMVDYARRAFSDRDDILIFPLSGPRDSVEFRVYYRAGKSLSPQASAFLRVAWDYLKEN